MAKQDATGDLAAQINALAAELTQARSETAKLAAQREAIDGKLKELRGKEKEIAGRLSELILPKRKTSANQPAKTGGPRWPLARNATTATRILTYLDDYGAGTVRDIADETKIGATSVSTAISKLHDQGMIEKVGASGWGLTAGQQKLMRSDSEIVEHAAGKAA